ncbi:MAG: PaaI family thioesterase [Gammaproteobacteria bacterium]|nr:PaaI family thioesterase [Gammaproteobacteria bacterium]MDP7270900.1 PaaI family thioesterase [Gammaproteobacteria bacterium]MDP7418273.1 PaaI family thioesterase [Gammaproteobacteria bacterium]HJP04742.1 PaaI family thioesterase [Gammaproteobacteria bacterium]
MNQEKARSDANRCFVCGPGNTAGLQVEFRLEGEVCKAEHTIAAHHCGYDNVTHGGIIFALLDDVMANWLFLKGDRAYTGKCDIRFREPVEPGTTLSLEGRLTSRKGRMAKMKGRATAPDGKLVAEAIGTFIVIPGE